MMGVCEARGSAVRLLGDAPSAGRVLVVEDEAGISTYLATVLGLAGYEVVCRESALGVGTVLRGWRPDAIVLELGPPYRSGAAVLADFKADPATATIPVVVLTAAPDSLPRERVAQAAAVLGKPVRMTTLLGAVRAALAAAPPGAPPVLPLVVPAAGRPLGGAVSGRTHQVGYP
jgi:DNA-binding response OmpR family regulator